MKKNLILTISMVLLSVVVFASTPEKKDKKETKEDYTKDLFLPGGYFNINYVMGFGTGAFHDFVPSASYRGFDAHGKKMMNQNFGLGGGLGWSGFNHKYPKTTYNFDDGAITGVGTTSYYNLSIYAQASYYPLPEALVKPYVSLNIGPVYQTVKVQIGQYYTQDQNWQFFAAPEVGVYIPFGPDAEVGLNAAVRYNYVSYSNTNYKLPNGISYFQAILGLGFMF